MTELSQPVRKGSGKSCFRASNADLRARGNELTPMWYYPPAESNEPTSAGTFNLTNASLYAKAESIPFTATRRTARQRPFRDIVRSRNSSLERFALIWAFHDHPEESQRPTYFCCVREGLVATIKSAPLKNLTLTNKRDSKNVE